MDFKHYHILNNGQDSAHMGIGLDSLQYGVIYLGSHYNTGPYIHFPHFGNSNLGKLPHHDDHSELLQGSPTQRTREIRTKGAPLLMEDVD